VNLFCCKYTPPAVPPSRFRCGKAGAPFDYKKYIKGLVEKNIIEAKIKGGDEMIRKRQLDTSSDPNCVS